MITVFYWPVEDKDGYSEKENISIHSLDELWELVDKKKHPPQDHYVLELTASESLDKVRYLVLQWVEVPD